MQRRTNLLPKFYEIGRDAAFGAIDAHEGTDANLRSLDMIAAAYHIQTELRDEEEWPEFEALRKGAEYGRFIAGYYDALTESGK